MQPSSIPQSHTDAPGTRMCVDKVPLPPIPNTNESTPARSKNGQVIGQEAQTLGVSQLFAPVVDLARELRYGRVSTN